MVSYCNKYGFTVLSSCLTLFTIHAFLLNKNRVHFYDPAFSFNNRDFSANIRIIFAFRNEIESLAFSNVFQFTNEQQHELINARRYSPFNEFHFIDRNI